MKKTEQLEKTATQAGELDVLDRPDAVPPAQEGTEMNSHAIWENRFGGESAETSTPAFWTNIEIGGEFLAIRNCRRRYYFCRNGCGRQGALILAVNNFPFNSTLQVPRGNPVRVLVVCERCGRRWRPGLGAALRALGR
jgi:hypothetical protein